MTKFLVIHKFHPSGERVTPATLLIQRFVVMYKKLMENLRLSTFCLQEVKLRSFSTAVHRVDAAVSYKADL